MPPRPNIDHVGAGLDLGGVDDGADAGGHAAADVAHLVERRVVADLRQRDLRQHGEIRERRAAHVVMERLAAERKAAGAIGHQALALRRADRRAEVGLARQARLALPALGRVERNHVIALLERRHAGADVDHDARALVAEDRRKEALRIRAGARVFVGVADAGRLDLDQHLARLGGSEIDRLDGEGCPCLVRNRRPDFHVCLLFSAAARRCRCAMPSSVSGNIRGPTACSTICVERVYSHARGGSGFHQITRRK